MCGNFNGQPSDDFIGKEKILHPTAIEFAKSWQHGRQDVCSVGVTQQEVSSVTHYISFFSDFHV